MRATSNHSSEPDRNILLPSREGGLQPRREHIERGGTESRVALGDVAKAIAVAGQQAAGAVERNEHLVGIVTPPCLPMGASKQPQPSDVLFKPRRAAPSGVPEPVNERMVDREDPLLSPRCRRRLTARLVHQRCSIDPGSTSTVGSSMPRSSRRQRESLRANDLALRTVKHLQRGEIERISHPLQPVETAGIEPASAVA